jgi:glutamine synthetase
MPDTTSTLPKQAADYLAAHPDTVAVDAFYADLSGVVRGKRYPRDLFAKLMSDGMAVPGSVFLLDTLGENHDPEGKGFSDGDPDYLAKVMPRTLVPMPWAEQPTAQVMITLVEADGSPYPFEPRNVLARVVERFAELDLTPVVAFELEFYLLDRQRLEGGAPQPPLSPTTGARESGTQVYGMNEIESFAGLLEDITEACRVQALSTGAVSAEYAPGQFEINLNHLDDPMLAADQCVMFKRVVKAIARKHGMQASFMAKPYLDCAGSGLHMHCSLLDPAGDNAFAGAGAAGDEQPISEIMEHALGGLMALMAESMGILAPNVNSFRRYVPNIFVPITRCWGHENRSVAFRIPRGGGKSRRIEHRIAGADVNPYLALATMLAGIHHGITNQIDPGPPAEGNAGRALDDDLPFRPRRALERMLEGDILGDYLGPDYVKAYAACKLTELDKFEAEISPAEYAWYLQAD